MPSARITHSIPSPPRPQAPRQSEVFFAGVVTSDGVRSSWNGHLPTRSAPCRVSLMPRASANRCTETSFFSRSTSCSGILAIFRPPPKTLSSTFFRFWDFLYRARVYTYCVYTYSEIRESRKMHLTITPVMPAKKPSQNAFGQRLVNLRQARGLTQIQLAKATGMTQRAISYYEIEAEFPPAPALITLAHTLEVTTDELLGVQPPRPAAREHPQEQRLWRS